MVSSNDQTTKLSSAQLCGLINVSSSSSNPWLCQRRNSSATRYNHLQRIRTWIKMRSKQMQLVSVYCLRWHMKILHCSNHSAKTYSVHNRQSIAENTTDLVILFPKLKFEYSYWQIILCPSKCIQQPRRQFRNYHTMISQTF